MFKKFGDLLLRFRIWRLNRQADSLLHNAERHKEEAKVHSAAASLLWMKSTDARVQARRIRAT